MFACFERASTECYNTFDWCMYLECRWLCMEREEHHVKLCTTSIHTQWRSCMDQLLMIPEPWFSFMLSATVPIGLIAAVYLYKYITDRDG